ncbi:QWRF motif-containing protein 8 [Phtheirospermum japonicum]|uniref:QWRF motif-containing protein 8 n=1 Tax=Phtheirospermum japonicum TaxID=374723 RepID=A0A830CXR0_9LAMI|nr:QWRF motif-containing protein 8 [Phtheirospermum japonicum]
MRILAFFNSSIHAQLTCLDEWTSIERDHVNSLTWAIQDLQASTIRIPVTGGAKGDVETVKAAICSAVDVMQAMGSSLFTILSRVEGMNSLVSELAGVAAQERAMLDECESVLGSTTAMQVRKK